MVRELTEDLEDADLEELVEVGTFLAAVAGTANKALNSIKADIRQEAVAELKGSPGSTDFEGMGIGAVTVTIPKPKLKWVKGVDPAWTGMDRIMPVRVNEVDYCNAYWDGNGITLGAGYGTCNDLAMFSDVIYHEYGHGIVDFQYRPYSPSGAMHEAFADYTACTITNEPYIGEGVIGGGYFRNMDNSLRYPEDLTGEVHDDGRILGGALWHMRENLWPDVALSD